MGTILSTPHKPSDSEVARIVRRFNAQLGEIAWHSVSIDTDFQNLSDTHTDYVRKTAKRFLKKPIERAVRFLEVAPYLHTTAQALNSADAVDSFACDISPHSLRNGDAFFRSRNSSGEATLVTGDFHDLPFSDNYFDIVFIASAVHHTESPELVIAELIRVAVPGGLIMIYNEPVKSDGCFFRFRCNRAHSLTDWERLISQAGLLRIISSSFPGSRDEQMFGMIENDKIPLDVYFPDAAEVLHLELTPHPNDLDRQFSKANSAKEVDRASAIADEISSRLAPARAAAGRREELMGYSLPDDLEIKDFAQKYAASLDRIVSADKEDRIELEARLYGATLQTVLRKKDAKEIASRPFRQPLKLESGVYFTEPKDGNLRIDLMESVMPAIEPGRKPELEHHFDSRDWALLDQGAGIYAYCLNERVGNVTLPDTRGSRQILLLRYYAVSNPAGPYWVDLYAHDNLIASDAICQSESRLLKLVLPDGCRRLQIRLREDGDLNADFHLSVRVAYLNVVKCRYDTENP